MGVLIFKISAVGTHGKKFQPLGVMWLTCFLAASGLKIPGSISISPEASINILLVGIEVGL
jgi:hypothetical protein